MSNRNRSKRNRPRNRPHRDSPDRDGPDRDSTDWSATTVALRLGAAALLAVAAACGGSGPARTLSGAAAGIFDGECVDESAAEIVVYSGRTENLIGPVLDAFSCQSGIGVTVRWGSSTDLALLLAEEGDRTAADVYLSRSPGPVGFLESRGLLGTIGDEVLSLVEPQHRSAGGTWVGFSGRKRVLVYNIDSHGVGDLPRSVFDLTDERFRGKVAIPATNGSFVDWFTVFRYLHGDDAAEQWLDDMVDNGARYYPNNRSIVEAAGRGEIDMGLVNHYYQHQEAVAAGDRHRAANWDLADDDIGSLLIITAATVTASTAKAEEAAALVAYLLSEPVQRYLTEETFEYPLTAGATPASVLPPLDALAVGSVDFDELGDGFADSTAIIEASGILNQ